MTLLFVGDDWAEAHHDVHLMNEAGDRLAAKRLPEGLEGIGRLHQLIAEHVDDPAQVVIAIETDAATAPLAATERFDLVIAADGSHSSLRRQICPKAHAPVYPWGAMWAILPETQNPHGGELDQIYDGCSVMIGLLPVGANPSDPHGRPGVSFFWSLRGDAIPLWKAEGLDAFKKRQLHTALADVHESIDELEHYRTNFLR